MIIKIQNKDNEKANNQNRYFTNKALEWPKKHMLSVGTQIKTTVQYLGMVEIK